MSIGEPGVGVGIEPDHRHGPSVVDQDFVDALLERPDFAGRSLQLDMH
jgi:hypothetical protein